jgi:hypothetical protein
VLQTRNENRVPTLLRMQDCPLLFKRVPDLRLGSSYTSIGVPEYLYQGQLPMAHILPSQRNHSGIDESSTSRERAFLRFLLHRQTPMLSDDPKTLTFTLFNCVLVSVQVRTFYLLKWTNTSLWTGHCGQNVCRKLLGVADA